MGGVAKGVGSFVAAPVIGLPGAVGAGLSGGDDPAAAPQQDIDTGTKAEIDAQAARAGRNDSDFAADKSQGIDQSALLAKSQQDMQEKQQSLGGQDYGAMQEALNRKASNSYGRDLNQMQRQIQAQAPIDKFTAMGNMVKNQQSVYGAQVGIYNQANQQNADAEAARNKMLGSILQTGGMAAGMAFGGPAGAALGGQLGGAATGPQASSQFNFNNAGSSVPTSYNSSLGRIGG